ncbi:MAG: tetratricopeptide repeat protein, partial [Coleofasciculaceae cyanobacterium]
MKVKVYQLEIISQLRLTLRKALPWSVVLVGVMGLMTGVATPTLGQTESNSAQQEELGEAQGLKATTVEGRLDSNSQTLEDGRYFNGHLFEGKADQQIVIELNSSEFDPWLFLFDSESNIIADDSGNGNNAKITVTLPTTGTYGITVVNIKAGETGNYTLSWREATADELELTEAENLHRRITELRNQGKYDEAIPLAERFLAIRKKVLGSEHPDVATSLNNLAYLYESQGRYEQAEPLYHQALEMYQRLLGQEHPDVATSLNNLAALYQSQGRYEQAEPLYRQALEINQRLLGQEHPSVADGLNNLAYLYSSQGRYEQAEPLYRRALEINQRLLGQKHPSVAVDLNNLALLYSSQGRYEQAEPLYRRALEINQRLLGQEHPNVATSLNNLASLYSSQGRYEQAEPLHRQALEIRQRLLGQEHPLVAVDLNNLALLYSSQGRYELAEVLYRQALEMRQRLLGQEHPDVAQSLNNLAGLYDSQGRYELAEVLYRQALDMWQRLLGSEHPHVATSLNNLAALYLAKDDVTNALNFFNQATAVEERNLDTFLTIGSERQKQQYMATLPGTTHRTISLHLQDAPTNPQAANLALTTLLRRKGRILDAVTNNLQTLHQNLTPENQKLLDQLASTRSQLAALIFRGVGDTPPDQYRQQIATLKAEANELENQLAHRSSQFRTQSQPVTIEAVQQLIPAEAALVELVLYKPYNARERKWEPAHYAAYILHSTGAPQWVDLGEAAPINQLVTYFRRSLQYPSSDIQDIARSLDEKLMQPIRPLLGETRQILLSPDSQLNLIPFAALVDENNDYLVENYSISYLSSGRDLLRLQNSTPSRQPAVLVANPDFDNAGVSSSTEECLAPLAPQLWGEQEVQSPPE